MRIPFFGKKDKEIVTKQPESAAKKGKPCGNIVRNDRNKPSARLLKTSLMKKHGVRSCKNCYEPITGSNSKSGYCLKCHEALLNSGDGARRDTSSPPTRLYIVMDKVGFNQCNTLKEAIRKGREIPKRMGEVFIYEVNAENYLIDDDFIPNRGIIRKWEVPAKFRRP